MSGALVDAARGVLRDAMHLLAWDKLGEELWWHQIRLDEPLRIAIAGRVKAGKSTLLNALVGERVAPTDATECTRIVTQYRDFAQYRVTARLRDGTNRELPFDRVGGALRVDLDGTTVDAVDHLAVDLPSSALRTAILIDTPGLASLQREHERRTYEFVVDQVASADTVDAVVFLMRHLHGADVRFLEAFHDDDASQPSPVNSVAVLSRADEIGNGRLDSMQLALTVADRYRSDPAIRRLAQAVVPVSGLLAETAATFRQDEFEALAVLARMVAIDDLLYASVDRFTHTPLDTLSSGSPALALSSETRAALLERLGMFGVRRAVAGLAAGEVADAPALARLLRQLSGVELLRWEITTRFAGRAEVLKARTALRAVEDVLRRSHPSPDRDRLLTDIERIWHQSLDLVALRALDALRTRDLGLSEAESGDAERIVGGLGLDIAARLGQPADTPAHELHATATSAAVRWSRRAEHPRTEHPTAEVARAVARVAQGLADSLRGPGS